ncbi:hypothetical protein [Phreatobacter stygius]|uniref:Uncharacterized protein n=1 Tax=Phreatobacter stygius TaxID=1940610 RepID=A0A4D7B7S1_9HYPH|nr:hypothetical protein [Phreatobacter stygius]QCI67025.1 hypothetical protein E8M01_23920 [Phreatobacter stygius]
MRLPLLVLLCGAAISAPALAQEAGVGNAGSAANYDYSYRFPGDLPSSGYDADRAQTEPSRRPARSSRARH